MYKDSDCGELASKLRTEWKLTRDNDCGARTCPHDTVQIMEIALGDLFVGIQNFAINILSNEGCDIMVTLAPSAFRYFDRETADDMMRAFADGARASAIAVPEDGLDEIVNRGTLGGPITAWKLKTLVAVGGFNIAAAQGFIDEEKPNAGVEEIHPLVHMIGTYGECVAPIRPRNFAVEKRKLDGEDLERHLKQIQSKTTRQLAHAKSLGVNDLDFFTSGVMARYRPQTVE
jgi:hypothetical protein